MGCRASLLLILVTFSMLTQEILTRNLMKPIFIDMFHCDRDFDVGFCNFYQIRYWYNETARECGNFTWGGCGGNENNFATLEDCENLCAGLYRIPDYMRPVQYIVQDN